MKQAIKEVKFYNVSSERVNSYDPSMSHPFKTLEEAENFIKTQKERYGEKFWKFEITPVRK